ncbi:MAG: beta-N-acetylhexosaminidase [Acidisphaera sp.]|nr:beta-N-acetylhexosaminidase [Acidisphaera sp.]
MRAAVVGISGPGLTPEERALFTRHPPAGVILFARNVQDRVQLASLVAALRAVLPSEAVLMVDQEGGRVARLQPPHWRAHPAAAALGALFAHDRDAGEMAAWLTGALIGLDCRAAGFDVACAPVLDLRVPGAHDVIGDRAFAADPDAVGRLGGQVAAGLLAAGVQPVIKHIPGHGRARADSHLELPRVPDEDLADDLAPFAGNAHMPWAMTAHVLYESWDPALPATLSPAVLGGVVRGRIGFQGVLVSDDLAMGALAGAPAVLAGQALQAGCDLVLHCTGRLAETAPLLAGCPEVTQAAAVRLQAGQALAARSRVPLDETRLAEARDRLLA